MIGGVTAPVWFNSAHRVGQELFMWMDPEDRGARFPALLASWEKEMQARGAKTVALSSVAGVRDATMARLYRRQGYRPMDNTYLKEV
jgi:hypothetical protein